jgi:hypothetical protein
MTLQTLFKSLQAQLNEISSSYRVPVYMYVNINMLSLLKKWKLLQMSFYINTHNFEIRVQSKKTLR